MAFYSSMENMETKQDIIRLLRRLGYSGSVDSVGDLCSSSLSPFWKFLNHRTNWTSQNPSGIGIYHVDDAVSLASSSESGVHLALLKHNLHENQVEHFLPAL